MLCIAAEVIGIVLAMAVHEGSALCRVSSDSQWQEARSNSRLVAVRTCSGFVLGLFCSVCV